MGTQARKVWVSGEVQGVGYRAWTKETAEGLGLAGWVRNLDDGRVEALFEGDGAAIDEMMVRIMDGPGPAVPTGTDDVEETPQGLGGFEIR